MRFPYWSSVIKTGKPRKVVIRKNNNYGSRKAKFLIWMKVDERGHIYCLIHANFIKEGEFLARVRI